jgi:dTDP-glucose 4,6-dehydratase
LVTGGAGFIGSNFIEYFLNKYSNYKLINYDKLTYAGNIQNLTAVEDNENYVFIKGDICDSKRLKNVFEEFNPEFVVNFAAETHVDRSIKAADDFIKTNIEGTQTLLEKSREHEIKKLVHISSDEVYGAVGPSQMVDEAGQIVPNNPYAASKAAADMLLRAAVKTHRQSINIVRSTNNYGPYQFPEKFIPLIIANAMHSKQIPIYGSGKNLRDWLHVHDSCRAIDMILHNASPGEIYNVSTNNLVSNLELAKQILQIMGKTEDLIKFVEDRPGHDFCYAVNSQKIKEDLGWSSKIDFEDGLKQTVQWYLAHEEWLDDISTWKYLENLEKSKRQEV